jgi:hypothetical protein
MLLVDVPAPVKVHKDERLYPAKEGIFIAVSAGANQESQRRKHSGFFDSSVKYKLLVQQAGDVL